MPSLDLYLNGDERDCLQELMNISYGSATAAIAEIIDKYATLNIPSIQTATIDGFRAYLDNKLDYKKAYYITNQLINGTLNGETLFIIDKASSENLALEFDLDEEEINDEELKDVVLEISNIITSTTLSKLAELVETTITFSPPQINLVEAVEDFNNHHIDEYSHIIIISTEICFKDQNIRGELLILSKDEAIFYLKRELNRILDEY